MKKDFLSRYERAETGEIIIDVSVGSIEDLYSYFDKAATYHKKDLDQDFVDYLIDCVKEIKKHEFLIRINLHKHESNDRMERVRRSITNYFTYLMEVERQKLTKLINKSTMYFFLGIALITLSFAFKGSPEEDAGVALDILKEGITIAAWVSMWQAFANIIFEWNPHSQNMKIYRRIISATVLFNHQKRLNL